MPRGTSSLDTNAEKTGIRFVSFNTASISRRGAEEATAIGTLVEQLCSCPAVTWDNPDHVRDVATRLLGQSIGFDVICSGELNTSDLIQASLKVGEALHLRPDPRQTHFFGEDGKAVRA